MKKYEGILLLADWDGTLIYNGEIPEENLRAIREFQREGGLFTVCSGRFYSYLENFKDKIAPNTFVASCNGAIIVDPATGEAIYRGFCDEEALNIVDRVLDADLGYNKVFVYDDKHDAPLVYTPAEYREKREKISHKKIYKLLLSTDDLSRGESAAKAVREMDLGDYVAERSWATSLEIMKKKNSKGEALRRIKKFTGARLAVAIGDYENDVSMIEAADIGYAVENACPLAKAYADRMAPHAKDAALAKVIEDLEAEFTGAGLSLY